ncbi:DUF4238 domain-containing protein [Nodosilinea sp. LEGE 07298]|uniref:DUF4238 domain-containing protein n=1 Tax=Nodosilinea sp. LEGE 07298 TaxID=2777970 RepID=UPI00187FDC12|nr:DUF4238 domain-containing protein [Nodosilinea sp. LEGE 07298]MBE9113646.1 DUF4238 domain-containing protein [Nodosilinea sp. LEGE 07298]
MAEFKNQHFVPQAYLRRFACDSSGKKILALVNNQWKTASIKGQCQKDYFFSRKEPKETESRIAWGETLLWKTDNKATAHQYSSALIWLLIELHFKSSRYVCDKKFERIEKLNKIFGGYLQASLLKQIGYTVETNDPAEVLYALQCSWTTKRHFFKEDTLITSDSPVVLIVVDNRLSVIVWPSSPSSIVIAYDFSYISDIRPARKDDFFADSLNNLRLNRCFREVTCKQMMYSLG